MAPEAVAMRVLITGACGFVGSTLAKAFTDAVPRLDVTGLDNLIRPGSERNRRTLLSAGVDLRHVDIRAPSDFENLPGVDWVIDAAANPSVLAGIDAKTSSRQLVEHNLYGTVNLLEFCKQHRAGFILLSTSRVYSIRELAGLPLDVVRGAFQLQTGARLPAGVSLQGVAETFSTAAPLSLYGCAKLASEILAAEYAEAFGIPVWINRCGVLSGAGQFGRPDQGIFAFWINAWLRQRPLTYRGFGGKGAQVRDCLHPRDLVPLLVKQMGGGSGAAARVANVGGGPDRSISLSQLSEWCERRFGRRDVGADIRDRTFDVPWLVMDSSLAEKHWDWRPTTSLESILDEIADHAERQPDWLDASADS